MSSCFRPPRLLPTSRTRSVRHVNHTRPFASARRSTNDPSSDDVTALSKEDEQRPERTGGAMKFPEWLATEGQNWKDPDPLGPKWLGGNVPFPLNPTFKPPTPLSDALRTTIYKAFVSNPKLNDIRTLSARYGVAIVRIEAIIRLKELEGQWKKSKPLQTGFLTGMERLLGLNVGGQMTPVVEELKSQSHRNMTAADEVSQQATDEGRDERRGISRTYFEPVDENNEPLVSRVLDELHLQSRTSRTQQPVYSTTIVQPDPAKPAYKFVDVGLRWVNRTDVERRAKESLRRRAIKSVKKLSDDHEEEQH